MLPNAFAQLELQPGLHTYEGKALPLSFDSKYILLILPSTWLLRC